MSADKYPSIFSRQMETIVYIYYGLLHFRFLHFDGVEVILQPDYS